jgi:hypothetical protein
MNLNPFKMISSGMQKKLVGGLVGSLTYWADRALADTQTWYPLSLKQKLDPKLPRNDELITTIAPPVIMYALYKKSPSKFKDMAEGTIMYSGPQLLDRVVVNAVGTPAAAMGLRVATSLKPLPIIPTATVTSAIRVVAPAPAQATGATYR